jgi:hypothetical protein
MNFNVTATDINFTAHNIYLTGNNEESISLNNPNGSIGLNADFIYITGDDEINLTGTQINVNGDLSM